MQSVQRSTETTERVEGRENNHKNEPTISERKDASMGEREDWQKGEKKARRTIRRRNNKQTAVWTRMQRAKKGTNTARQGGNKHDGGVLFVRCEEFFAALRRLAE